LKKVIIEGRHLSNNTGISHYFMPLLIRLVKNNRNLNFLIVTQDNHSLDDFNSFDNVEILILKTPFWIKLNYLINLYYSIISLPIFLLKNNADLLVSPYYDFIIPKNFNKKTIVTIHDLCYFKISELYKIHTRYPNYIFFRGSLEKCCGIFTVSKSSLKDLLGYIPKNKEIKTEVVYNCFTKPEKKIISKKYSIKNIFSIKGKKIIYTGGFENRKNLGRLFSAFYKVINLNEDVFLVITGNLEKNNKFIKLIKSYRVEKNILFTGVLDNQEMECLYQSDLIGSINISLCEGFGRNSYEAKIHGIPLLCSDIDVNHEVVGDYPFYCNPYNENEIYEGINKLINNEIRYRNSNIESRFTIDYNYKKFTGMINYFIE